MRDRHAAEAASMDSMKAQQQALDSFTESEKARNAATSEQLALQREIEAVRKRAGEAGASLTDRQASDFAAASLAGNPRLCPAPSRLYEVPCPECGAFAEILWDAIRWDEGKPETARWQGPAAAPV